MKSRKRKCLKPKNHDKLRNKKRIIVDENKKSIIKKMMKQGFNSKIIAEETNLPISVVKRYYNADYFKVKNRKKCAKCQTKINHGITCNACKKKASLISDDGQYVCIENKPSQIPNKSIPGVRGKKEK